MCPAYLMTPGFLARSDSIFLTQESHVMPAMESVHERTGSDAVPEEEAVVRGAILESLKERKFLGIQDYSSNMGTGNGLESLGRAGTVTACLPGRVVEHLGST